MQIPSEILKLNDKQKEIILKFETTALQTNYTISGLLELNFQIKIRLEPKEENESLKKCKQSIFHCWEKSRPC